jgi:hypothetical protein
MNQMAAMTVFKTWLEQYGRAWIQGDPDAIVVLFAPNCRYYETPFDEPMVGRTAVYQYWVEGAKEGQEKVTFTAVPITVQGQTGYAHWQATFTRQPQRSFVELDGILAATFDEAGFCTEFREWWHRRENNLVDTPH